MFLLIPVAASTSLKGAFCGFLLREPAFLSRVPVLGRGGPRSGIAEPAGKRGTWRRNKSRELKEEGTGDKKWGEEKGVFPKTALKTDLSRWMQFTGLFAS
jgi:hypothetical protein